MGQVFFRWLNRSIFFIFLCVVSIIVGLNIFYSRGYHSLELKTPTFFNGITLIGALIVIAVVLIYRNKIISFINKIPKPYFIVTLLLVSVLLQFTSVRLLSVNLTWDFGTIVKSAKLLLENNELGNYFVMYPNNILLTCILAIVGKISTPDLFSFQVFNIMIITLSQYLIYRITSKVAGYAIGIVSLFMGVFLFPYIFYAPIVYTDTVSLIFLLLPLNMLIDKNGNLNSRLSIILIASVFFSFGMVLKGSLIIFIIALSIVLFLFLQRWKKLYFILPFIVLLLVKTGFSYYIYENEIVDKKQVDRYSFPVTHWLVMAQNGERYGKFATEDFHWTHDLLEENSREKVKQIHLNELKKRITEKGWIGNLHYNIQKLAHTWTDGTYYSLNKLKREPVEPENFNRLVDFKSGDLLQGFARIQHFILLAGLLFIVKLKKRNEMITFAMLSIIGFFLFFLIWETRSRYLVSLTPLLIIVSCIGYFGINKKESS